MVNDLSNKIIFDDFKEKTLLTKDEEMVLIMLIRKESIIYISQELCISDRTVSRIIKSLKKKYYEYKELELAKLKIFLS